MFFPDQCPLCRRAGSAPCVRCIALLPSPPSLYPPASVDRLVALTSYEDSGAALVRALKYANRRGPLAWMATTLAARLAVYRFDQVTWMPSSHSGRRKRGYEPSKILAQAVAKALGIPAVKLMDRPRGDRGQTQRSRQQRLLGPTLRLDRETVGRSILIIDDVCTTGASLSAAAALLRQGGAQWVHGAVIARTP